MLDIKEIRAEDQERLIRAARQATESIRTAIYQHNYNHPLGNLLLAYTLTDQSSYQDAASNIDTYFAKLKELEKRSSFLAANCDYGFRRLYALGYDALGLMYFRQSQYEADDQKKLQALNKAIENYQQVIQLDEGNAGAYKMLGAMYVQRGEHTEAIKQYEKAIAREANEVNKAWNYAGIAWAYSSMGRTADAIDALNKAIRLRPDIAAYYSSLASIYKNQGNFDEAIKLEKEAIAHRQEPSASSYWSLATHYFARARQKYSDADYEEIIKLLNKAIGINRSYSRAYMLLGHVYKFYKGGAEADKALANYEEAAKYNPNDAAIYFHIGDLYLGVKKNDDAAIKYLKEAIKHNPNYALAYEELGQAYHNKHDDAQAIKYLLEAIRSDSNYQDVYSSLITIYKSQKNYSEAIKLLKKVLEIFPKEFWPYKELAKVNEAQGNNEIAIRYYELTIPLLKTDDTFGKELYRCRIERLRGHFAEAIACFKNLRTPSSEDPGQQAYDIGLTYVASKNKKAALAQHQQLLQLKSALAEDLLRQIEDMK